jgi:hypothetical protein
MNVERFDPAGLRPGDLLRVADNRNDFPAGGRLAVAGGGAAVPAPNRSVDAFVARGLRVGLRRLARFDCPVTIVPALHAPAAEADRHASHLATVLLPT